MTTTQTTLEQRETTASASQILTRLLGRYWNTLKERRERARVRATLYGMSNRELKDLGFDRSEIESVMVDNSGERIRAHPKQNQFRRK